MGFNVIAHNLPAMNAERTLGVNTGSKIKAMEKLASGYRINRSADDAAGLAISEKMRRMIRGLNQGTHNAQDGASWVQIGDGSLDEAHSMLHRMTQLTVQSLNGTWTDSDRAAMQAEFEQLKTEIDRLTDATTFNENHIFAEHEIPYYQFEGNIRWMPNQKHLITEDTNTLDIVYRMAEGEPQQSVSIQVPMGQYTTKELMDEIDTALENAGLLDKGFQFEYTTQGTCNLNLEGGVSIDEAKGGLAYLLYDVYEGGSTGALIGTTRFESDDPDVTLKIVKGKNDEISFDVVGLDGTTKNVKLTVPTKPDPLDPAALNYDRYTRPELIDWLNKSLKDLKDRGELNTIVEAIPHGKGIKLTSDDSIITALKGNMFKVDDKDKGEAIYTSIFYDNIGYGPATMLPAVLTGGAVLSTQVNDLEHGYYHIIRDSNDKLLVKPNGRGQAEELTIPEGYYTINEMARELEALLAGKGLDMDLKVTVSGNAATDAYQGLVVTSKVSGLESDVGIDKSSSAYDTLFVIRAYNKLEEHESYIRDEKPDRSPTYTGSKSFVNAGNWPFLVEAGVNDKFVMSVNNKKYEITLDTGGSGAAVYNNQTEMINAINGAIQKRKDAIADAGEAEQLGSVRASWYNNRVYLTSSDRRVDSINVSAAAGSGGKVNEGYADIFTTQASYQVKTANSSNGVVKLSESIDVPVTIHDSEKTFAVRLDGVDHTMTLTPRTYNTYEEILAEINKNLPKAEVKDDPIVFNTVNVSGSNTTFQPTPIVGRIVPPANPINLKGLGSSGDTQGDVKPGETDTAATITMGVPYLRNPPGITIDGNNDQLKININGVEKPIKVGHGTYTSVSALAAQLQKDLNADTAFGTGLGGVDVKASGRNIILTTRKKGDGAGIICSSSDSKFIEHINTDIVAASMSLNKYPLSNSIKIEAGKNDTFKFKYNGKDYTLKLAPKDSYDKLGLQKAINAELERQKIPVRVTENGGYTLTFTETTPGNGNKLEFDSSDGGTCVASLFGKNAVADQPASATLNQDMQKKITIGANNTFQMTINGKPETITLPANKTYNEQPDLFLKDLNTALSGKGVTATRDGQKLTFTTTATGSAARIYLTYNENSALKDIFGTQKMLHRGMEAEFDPASHKLVLKALGVDDSDGDGKGDVDPKGSIVVSSNTGSIFQKANKTIVSTSPGTSAPGYHSKIYSTVKGAPLRGAGGSAVTLNQWNNKLAFRYYYNGTYRDVNVTLDIGSGTKVYSYDDLKTELEDKLNAGLSANHSGRLSAEVSADGVKIKAGMPGQHNYFQESSFSGGFYYNVLRRTAETMQKTKPVVTKGRNENSTYAVGRKDLRNNTTLITKGVNDTLTLDFTYGKPGGVDTVKKLTMTLDAGSYSGTGMAAHIQKKLNEQLAAEGLEPNLIQAKIGGINTGVSGNNDNNSLIFSMANDVKLPSNDKDTVYTIDGIGGNAAFSVFYQTDGDIRIAYVTGTKDVSNGVRIPKDSGLSFDVDGKHYELTMPSGRYSQDQMLEELNKQLKAVNAPVIAKVTDGYLTLSHSKYGKHQITNISGDAKKWLFFQENGEKEGNKDIWIRVGSESGDGVVIERPTMNTAFLGINSLTIEKPKYAEKALGRVKKAVTTVSSVRSYFGSMQNRLEHTIDQNNNTAENMQAAESAIRDTDMAREVLNMSKSSILENVGSSLLAQANRSRQDVLALLQ